MAWIVPIPPSPFGNIALGDLDASTIGAGRPRWSPRGWHPAASTPTCRCLGDHPERRRRRRLPGPLAAAAQERRGACRRDPLPAGRPGAMRVAGALAALRWESAAAKLKRQVAAGGIRSAGQSRRAEAIRSWGSGILAAFD